MKDNREKSWDDIVFEFKNKEYGAYYLRKKYNRDLLSAFSLGLIILILIVAPIFLSEYSFYDSDVFEFDETVTVNLMNLDLKEDLQPPPELPPLLQEKKVPGNIIKVVDETTKEPDIQTVDEMKDSLDNVIEEPVDTSAGNFGSTGAYQYYVIEEKPEFPGGGVGALLKWIAKNTLYPQAAQDNRIKGKVIVQFIIDVDGSVTEVQLMNKVNPLLDAEALRVVKSMPKWKPGKQKGKPVRVIFQIPINFTLF